MFAHGCVIEVTVTGIKQVHLIGVEPVITEKQTARIAMHGIGLFRFQFQAFNDERREL
jgi:hypothetical protein